MARFDEKQKVLIKKCTIVLEYLVLPRITWIHCRLNLTLFYLEFITLVLRCLMHYLLVGVLVC